MDGLIGRQASRQADLHYIAKIVGISVQSGLTSEMKVESVTSLIVYLLFPLGV
jgi:hypothetical protein